MPGLPEVITVLAIYLILKASKVFNIKTTPQDEIKFGNKVLETLNRKGNIIILKNTLIEHTLSLLKQNFPLRLSQFNIYVQKDDNSINAMALPGGHIIITEGFYNLINTHKIDQKEIAGVLSHEIGHIELGHTFQSIRSKFIGKFLINVIRFSKLQTLFLSHIGLILYKQKLSREKEFEADAFAVEMLMKANLPLDGLSSFLNKLKKRRDTTYSSDYLISYFDTHPPLELRIQKINKIIKELPL